MRTHEANELEWDSEFFGCKCGELNIFSSEELNVLSDEVEKIKNEYDFLILRNIGNNPEVNWWINEHISAALVDINSSLKLSKDRFDKFSGNKEDFCIAEALHFDNQEILTMVSNFKSSRFSNDPHISSEQTNQLYLNWVRNSEGKPNKKFCFIVKEKELAGFILFTIDKKNKSINLDLVSTNEKYQGQGIATGMIGSIIGFANKNEIDNITTGTQVNNLQAINVYIRNGFSISGVSSIYHYWKNEME